MELRLYSFVNFYLSGIQKGIQTAHAIADLEVEYRADFLNELEQKMAIDDTNNLTLSEFQYMGLYTNWAENHKTIIVLDGGNSGSLLELFNTFLAAKEDEENTFEYPFTVFAEDEVSLNSAVTCVAIVLPENIFGVTSLYKKDPVQFIADAKSIGITIMLDDGSSSIFTYTDAEIALIDVLSSARLASN